jgi:cytochrome c5
MIKRNNMFGLLAAAALAVSLAGCESNSKTSADASASQPEAAVSKAEQRGTARVIRLPKPKVNMPDGPNKELVMVQCAMCHTPQYITLQPPLSKDAWTASITKMRTTFSGPIPEDQVPKILEYVLAVNGAK